MVVGFYSPYLDTLGGGERYVLSLASSISRDHTVHVFWDDPSIRTQAEKRLNIDLSLINIVPNFWVQGKMFEKMAQSRRYDAIVFLSDGSIPLSFAKKTILHFQFPVPWVNGKSIVQQFKIKRIDAVLCNSQFVKTHIDQTFGISSHVIYPGISVESFSPKRKTKTILSVGRFTADMNTKKQAEMIDAFEKLVAMGIREWKLVLAGSVLPKDAAFVTELRKKARKLPVEFSVNASFLDIKHLYETSSLYWHAAGFGEDLHKHPERAEHFGISVVEAMAGGAIPLVFKGGGLPEIVYSKSGVLWTTLEDLVRETAILIKSEKKRALLHREARKRAMLFDELRTHVQFVRLLKP